MDSRQTTLTMASGYTLVWVGERMAGDQRTWVSRRAGKVTAAGKAVVAYTNGGSRELAVAKLRDARDELSTHSHLVKVDVATDATDTITKVLEAIDEA